jgi:hypothetical protein
MGVCKIVIKSTLILVLLLLNFLLFSFLFNKYQVKPTENEIIELKRFYKNKINIKNTNNIILLQNYTIDNIAHNSNGINEIDIIKILKTKKGLCFHRSLIMQKVMMFNGIKIRPIFLFSNPFQKSTSIFDFFSTKVFTHNVFEYYWNEKWYVMETNNKMLKPLNLNEFLSRQKIFRIQPRFVKYLNNRNGRFIKPSWIPDIY